MTICSGAGGTTTGWTTTGTTVWASAGDTKVNAAAPSMSLRMAGEKIRTDIAVLLKFAPARCRLRATGKQTSNGNVAFRIFAMRYPCFRPTADIGEPTLLLPAGLL